MQHESPALWEIPGRAPCPFPWRAPGDVDRASEGAAARRLYLPSPLHESCRLGELAQVEARLDAGADVDELDGVWQRGARHRPRALAALTRRARDQGDHTPLHFAAGYDQPEVVKLLLSRGAALEKRDKARPAAPRQRRVPVSYWPCHVAGPRRQWGKAPVDWALQSLSPVCVQLMRAEAVKRGVGEGKGAAAPLQTMTEFFHGMTDEEMRDQIQAENDKLVERRKQQNEHARNRPPVRGGVARCAAAGAQRRRT